MNRLIHPVEKLIHTIIYKGVDFEVVERPDVFWVGSVDYAKNNADESDIDATLKRFQSLSESAPKNEIMNSGWSAALSINYSSNGKPKGIMFANESYTDKQDERYDILTQPGGLWLRVRNDENAAAQFFGYEKSKPFNPWEYGPYKYFAGDDAPLQSAAIENGYEQNPDVHLQIEYHCHDEYSTPPHTNYAYIPIRKK
jgi:hypothetical protein